MDLKLQGLRCGHRRRVGIGLGPPSHSRAKAPHVHVCDTMGRAGLAGDKRPGICAQRMMTLPTRYPSPVCSMRPNSRSAASTHWSTTRASPGPRRRARTSPWRLGTHAGGQSHRTVPVRAAGRFRCSSGAPTQHREPVLGGGPLRISAAARRTRRRMGRDRPPTKSLSIELGISRHPGQRVCPVRSRTAHRRRIREQAAARGVAADVVREEALAKTSLHRLFPPTTLRMQLLFLASNWREHIGHRAACRCGHAGARNANCRHRA